MFTLDAQIPGSLSTRLYLLINTGQKFKQCFLNVSIILYTVATVPSRRHRQLQYRQVTVTLFLRCRLYGTAAKQLQYRQQCRPTVNACIREYKMVGPTTM